MGRKALHVGDTAVLVKMPKVLADKLTTWAKEESYPAGTLRYSPNILSRTTLITQILAKAVEEREATKKVGG